MSDLISRRKAFEYFVTLWECIGTIMDRDEWEDVCMTTANEIPSAQPERKTGRWIRNDNGTYFCSVCQSWIPEEQHYYARYCLYCGADMRGEQNEQND